MADYVINTAGTAEDDLLGAFHKKELLETLFDNSVMAQFAQQELLQETNGLTITFHSLNAFAKGEILTSQSEDPTAGGITAGTKTVTMIQMGDKKVISNLMSRAAVVNMVSTIQKYFGESAAATLDDYIQGSLFGTVSTIATNPLTVTAVSSLITAGQAPTYTKLPMLYLKQTSISGVVTEIKTSATFTALTSGFASDYRLSRLSVRKCRHILSKFKEANVKPIGDSYVCVSRPAQIDALRSDPDYADWNMYGNSEKVFKGETGKIEGIRFVESTNIIEPVTTGLASTDRAHFNIFLGRNCFAISNFSGDTGVTTTTIPFSQKDHSHALGLIATIGWLYTGAVIVLEKKAGLGVITVDAR